MRPPAVSLRTPSASRGRKTFRTASARRRRHGLDEGSRHLTPEFIDKKKRQKTRALEIKGATQRAHTVRSARRASGHGDVMREEPSGATTNLYHQPTYDKIRPIGASSKNERFMGTDFSYLDFEKRDTDEGIYRFGADKARGSATCRVVNVTLEKGP